MSTHLLGMSLSRLWRSVASVYTNIHRDWNTQR
jgi:hypothetical protein